MRAVLPGILANSVCIFACCPVAPAFPALTCSPSGRARGSLTEHGRGLPPGGSFSLPSGAVLVSRSRMPGVCRGGESGALGAFGRAGLDQPSGLRRVVPLGVPLGLAGPLC